MSDADAIRADIELTRSELASTVDALHSKLDAKALARRRLREARDRAAAMAQENKSALLVSAGAVLLLLVVRRSRRRAT